MKRFAILASTAALAASALVTAAPASADPGNACVAVNGRANLSAGIYLPVIQVTANVGFSISAGGCVATGVLVTASCGNSTGSGTVTVNGHTHAFDIVTVGGAVAVSGGLNGSFTATPDVAGGESCTGGAGADVFIVNGSAVTA